MSNLRQTQTRLFLIIKYLKSNFIVSKMKCKLKTTKGLDDMIRHSELRFPLNLR